MHTSTWDDWLVTRTPTGDQYADGVAGLLHNHNVPELDLSAEGTRDGLRQLFVEFEEATAGQQIHGRSLGGMKRRAPDVWNVRADPAERTVTITYGRQGELGMFSAMDATTAANFLRDVSGAIRELDGETT